MPDSDLYIGLAGIAVVFAGFAGISVVLTGRQPGQWRKVDAGRLSTMISLSFGTAFFSLLPVVVARLLTSIESLWQLCSVVFLIYAVIGMTRGFVSMRAEYRKAGVDHDTTVNITLFFLVAALAAIALTANIFRVLPALGEGFYLIALVCFLGLAARMFFRTLTVLRTFGDE